MLPFARVAELVEPGRFIADGHEARKVINRVFFNGLCAKLVLIHLDLGVEHDLGGGDLVFSQIGVVGA